MDAMALLESTLESSQRPEFKGISQRAWLLQGQADQRTPYLLAMGRLAPWAWPVLQACQPPLC